MKKKIMIFLCSLIYAPQFFTIDNISASVLKIKVFEFAVSQNADCSNLVTVVQSDTGVERDVLTNPQFGQGTVADGTYPCVAIKFSDNITFQPSADTDSGNCFANTEYTLEVCQAGTETQNMDGTDGDDCQANVNFYTDNITMYLSTSSTTEGGGPGNNAFKKPTSGSDSTNGLNLGNALTVAGSTVAKFIVNAANKVCDGADSECDGEAGRCNMHAPLFSFSKVN